MGGTSDRRPDIRVSVRAHTNFRHRSSSGASSSRSRRVSRIARPYAWYALFGLRRLTRHHRALAATAFCAALLAISPIANGAARTDSQPTPADRPSRPDANPRHAILRIRGDLDAQRTADNFVRAIEDLAERNPRLILVELGGNRTRPDLLFSCARALRDCPVPTAAWLADPADRTAAPGMLGLALAADQAGLHPTTAIVRTPGDDLTGLDPEVEDWAVIRLDLRALARDLAETGPLDRLVYESALAPRSSLWITRDPSGVAALTDEEPPAQTVPPLVRRTPEGWSFDAPPTLAADLYRLPRHRTRRAFERSLGLRTTPLETIEIESGLRDAHTRARTLIGRVRDAVRLAESSLDVRAGRAATTRIMPHEYHAAADRAAPLLSQSREAIAEIATLSTEYPELLHLDAPADADAPTEIGGPTRTSLSAWREAVRDAEYDLGRLEDRVETYRRR